jgi:hypothetical protein
VTIRPGFALTGYSPDENANRNNRSGILSKHGTSSLLSMTSGEHLYIDISSTFLRENGQGFF